MALELRKATRRKAKIRLGLSAVSGGGKTYSAILIAKGLVGDLSKVAIIDTEHGSADLYSHMGDYNVLPLTQPFSPERYIEAIRACEKAGMEVIIIDSITHEWDGKGGCLEIVDSLGGKYQDWAKVTPRHQAFIDAILHSPCHVLTTVRRKQDYEMTKDNNGKVKVEKAGLKEVTREGFEYELTVNLELDQRHNATASKDRTGLFMGRPEFVPSEETGKMIAQWCEEGEEQAGMVKPGSEWYQKVEACQTQKELVDLYQKNKTDVDCNPLLQQLFAGRRNEINKKPAPAPEPVKAAEAPEQKAPEAKQEQAPAPVVEEKKEEQPPKATPTKKAAAKKEETPAAPKAEDAPPPPVTHKERTGLSDKAFTDAVKRIEGGEGSLVEKLRETFVLTEAQEEKLRAILTADLPF